MLLKEKGTDWLHLFTQLKPTNGKFFYNNLVIDASDRLLGHTWLDFMGNIFVADDWESPPAATNRGFL